VSVDNWVSIGIAAVSWIITGSIAFWIRYRFSAERKLKIAEQTAEQGRKHNEEKFKRKKMLE